jgi:putative tryptophan/tyrosine transport system substrate-binding protein
MDRRRFLVTCLVVSLATPRPVAAQRASSTRPARIGHLDSVPGATTTWDSFVAGLRDAGWAEGRNVVFERRFSEGRPERFAALARELVETRVDVIVSSYTPAIHAAKQATSAIPIVMAGAGDPTGLVASLARPGGNVTGVTALTPQLGPKLLQILRELVPAAVRIAYVLQGSLVHRERLWDETERGARALGLQLIPAIVDGPEDLGRRLQAMVGQRPDGVIVHGGPLVVSHIADVIAFMLSHKLPAVYDIGALVRRGALISYGASFPDLARRAAGYVDKILKGATPGDLPVEQPTKFELVINLKTAKALGLTIPPSLLVQADQVIE